MNPSKLFMLLALLACVVCAPASAHDNPTVAACGLPAQGAIVHTVTYTLSADCTQTDTLSIATANPVITVTINGGGYTITGGAFTLIFGSGVLDLNDLTIDGANTRTANMLSVGNVNARNVTFTRALGLALTADQFNLSNVLFSWNRSTAFSLGGNASAPHARPNSSHTLTNVVFRNNFGSGGAVLVHNDASLTTNGCLTLTGNVP